MRGRKRGGNGGEKKRERRGACNHFLKHLMPVYQLPVYLLIGQFDGLHIIRKISRKNLKESKWRVSHVRGFDEFNAALENCLRDFPQVKVLRKEQIALESERQQ